MKLTLRERVRAAFEDPSKRIREAGVARGSRVADIGAGRGYFAIAAAEEAGEKGMVYAVEPDPERNRAISERAGKAGLSNMRVLEAKVEDLREIEDGSVDVAFSMYSLHHFESLERGLAEIRRVLRPGGTFYVHDIVRGRIFRHGTRREDLGFLAHAGFSNFELLGFKRFLKARLTK